MFQWLPLIRILLPDRIMKHLHMCHLHDLPGMILCILFKITGPSLLLLIKLPDHLIISRQITAKGRTALCIFSQIKVKGQKLPEQFLPLRNKSAGKLKKHIIPLHTRRCVNEVSMCFIVLCQLLIQIKRCLHLCYKCRQCMNKLIGIIVKLHHFFHTL